MDTPPISTETKGASGYMNPAVQLPSQQKVRQLAAKIGLDLDEDELVEMAGCVRDMVSSYDKVYRMVEPKPEVKYPRLPGYRPAPEDNKYNAWYLKTDIKGAETGKLAGKTVAVKDSMCVAGVQMMNGSKLLEGYTPEFDATVVTRTLDAGGHIVGKSACEHFCLGGNSHTNDLAPVLNPWDITRTTGGSSSGSGALVAAGEVDLALGGDQGGSIRMPAAWCGIVGMKATWGLVPYTGIIPIEPSVDFVGPMARTVTDCALYLEVLAGCNGMDDRQKLDIQVPEYSKLLTSDISKLRVGVVLEGFEHCEPDVVQTVNKAAAKLAAGGARVSEINIPMHACGADIWRPVCLEGAYSTLVERGGMESSMKGFHSVSLLKHLTRSFKASPNDLSMPMKMLSIFGSYIKEDNNYEYYSRGCNLTMTLTAAYDKALEEHDVLIMPTLPYKAPQLSAKVEGIKKTLDSSFMMIGNTAPFNATGHPALSINAGFSEGLPIGMMIIGRKWHEQDVFNAAYGFECLREPEEQLPFLGGIAGVISQ